MLEILIPIATNIPSAVAMAVGAGMIRNLGGFLENALSDGKLDSYEIKKLGGTVLRYFVYILLLSLNFDMQTSTVIAFGMDYSKSLATKIKQ